MSFVFSQMLAVIRPTRTFPTGGFFVSVASFFFVFFRVVLGSGAPAAFAGFAIGYLAYDTIHFAVHHVDPRSATARRFRQRHFRHHYANSTRDFGVSSPLWDYILGTAGRSKTGIPT